MKKLLLVLVIALFSQPAMSQSDSLKWVKEINEQVWKPFITHLISDDKEGFRSVHSKRITRIEIDGNAVLDYEKYFPTIDPNAIPVKKNSKLIFGLRFDKRISNGTRAWETGYYKGTVMQEGKEPRSYYGRFFVVLEKENGTWKILVDADTGKAANEENFNKAFPMEKN
ncbi:MAG: nuclear transport factor 2 family protein [Chitinophagaceae bacterium]|nr:nuclear transport factor 2 family protein [Chitinophagaceae bacterium]